MDNLILNYPFIINKLKIIVAGIVVQQEQLLENPFKKKRFGGSQFNYGDLSTWAANNDEIPQDKPEFEHVPFIIKSLSTLMLKVVSYKNSMSTRFLIKNAMRRKHVMTDATYKLVYKG